MASDDQTLGDIATHLILENDKVRIWNLVVAPGSQVTGIYMKMTM